VDLDEILRQMFGGGGGFGGNAGFGGAGGFGGGGFGGFGGGHGRQTVNLDIESAITVPFNVAILGGKHGVTVQGESFDIKIPAGIKDGEKLRVRGKGHKQGGQSGDLYLKINVAHNPEYERDGDNLVKSFDLPLSAALFGDKILINTLEKEITLKVPQNTKNGQRFRVKEMGAVNRKTNQKGDLYLKANIVLPNVDALDESLVAMMKEKLPKTV
jgi:curved DNA-binding protein